jgi:hypothetical protein
METEEPRKYPRKYSTWWQKAKRSNIGSGTMKMKDHILAALQEQFDSWEELLADLNEEQITAPHFDLDWSIKDVIAHLWAWQQISIARMEAGLQDRKPEFPA